jgi:hypothetical protein
MYKKICGNKLSFSEECVGENVVEENVVENDNGQ